MRALKLLTSFVTWRWTPCVALIASSLLYVLIVVLVTPKTLSFGGSPKSVNVIEGPAPANALTTGADRAGSTPRRPAAAPPPTTPVLAPVPVAPPPSPPEEPRRVEPPPAPAAPPPAAPTHESAEDEEEGAAAPPPPAPNPNARFMATPLRFIPQLAASAGAVAAAPPSAEDH